MNGTIAKGLSHREFLKMCGLALVSAGASQMVVPPKPALAADGDFDNLRVRGNAYLCTTVPGALLQVGSGSVAGLGNIQLRSVSASYMSVVNDTTGVVTFVGSDVNTYGIMGTFSNHPVGIRAANVERLRITTLGRVGIGTQDPVQMLEVSGASEPLMQVTHTGMTGNPFLLMGMNMGNNAALFQAANGKDFKFYNGQYALTIRGSDGYVGIGTMTPLSILSVNRIAPAGSILPIIAITGAFQDATAGRSIDYYINNLTYPAARIANVTGGTQGILAFYTSPNFNGAAATEMMRILGNGNVGIGTTNPGGKLEVAGEIKVNGAIAIKNDGVAARCYYDQ
ncbi:MAG: hypothetical protein HY675_20355 [Chloroflexi bacterium]|nr:hypothetical protein [Chloroflexota bacterium]